MLKMGITIIKPDYNENFITLRKVFMQNIISVICCILMISYFSLGYAADIPNGVVLSSCAALKQPNCREKSSHYSAIPMN
ncbi:hypothetical protein YQ86_25115 [Salmonella enterica subsp. enterica]|nr:hypothetical protein [Salmonella enterica subsp. enterica]EEJ2576890.1 hypothetical protein [Salmonella enterica subsp. enterica]